MSVPGANGVTLRNITADGAVYITGASNVSVLGGQVYSPVPVKSDSQIASLRGLVPTNILIDGVSFHDFHDVGPGQVNHIECLQVGAAINLTIRNSSFRNCATHDIFIRSWGMLNNSPSPLSNVVVENNLLAKTTERLLCDAGHGRPVDGSASYLRRHPEQLRASGHPRSCRQRNRPGSRQHHSGDVRLFLQLIRSKAMVRLQRLRLRCHVRTARPRRRPWIRRRCELRSPSACRFCCPRELETRRTTLPSTSTGS